MEQGLNVLREQLSVRRVRFVFQVEQKEAEEKAKAAERLNTESLSVN